MKRITYAVSDTGLVYSRIGSEIAVPVLEYDKMLPSNNFTASYHLEKAPVFILSSVWHCLTWTRKIPIDIKNTHREFWGMKLLTAKKVR